jgi:hypothetical protein
MKKSRNFAYHVLNSNIAIDSLPKLQLSLRIFALFEKITVWWKHRGGCTACTIHLFQKSVWCEKCDAARHCAVIGKQSLNSNDRNRVRWAVLGLSQDRVCTDSFENFSVKSLKRDQLNYTKFNPPLFSLVNTLHFSELGGGGLASLLLFNPLWY